MRDLSDRARDLSFPSEGAGNTVSDPEGHRVALTAPGSDSVNPIPTALDRSPLPVVPPQRARTVLVGDGGEPASAAADQDRPGGWRLAGGYEDVTAGGWSDANSARPSRIGPR